MQACKFLTSSLILSKSSSSSELQVYDIVFSKKIALGLFFLPQIIPLKTLPRNVTRFLPPQNGGSLVKYMWEML